MNFWEDVVKAGWKNQPANNIALGVFEALSICDFITPLFNIAQTIKHDPTPLQTNSWTFFIPYRQALKGGWNANDIQGLLSQHGISSWGSQITNGDLFFTVSREQAKQAENILLEAGIPLNARFVGAPDEL